HDQRLQVVRRQRAASGARSLHRSGRSLECNVESSMEGNMKGSMENLMRIIPEIRRRRSRRRLRVSLCGRDRTLALPNVAGLQALRPLHDLELDALPLGERLEAFPLDRGEVHEYVLATFLRDEAETLRVVEPLHSTRCHC